MKMPLDVELFPTLLTIPRWFGTPEVKILPCLPEHYFINEVEPGWFVVTDLDNERIYSGLGPASVERSRAPFQDAMDGYVFIILCLRKPIAVH